MQSDQDLKILRHSVAHLLAQAVVELFPDTKLTIGPATADGFFYDFLPTTNFREQDLEQISAKMHDIVQRNLPITHEEITKEKARMLYCENRFKLELIDGIEGDTVGLSVQGDFYDLCRGGHVASTGILKHFKLEAISGAYWRADRNNQPLQRISGTAFHTAEELHAYEARKEQALKYDHRKLGKQLDLFSFHVEGTGFPFFHPKGTTILDVMKQYLRKQLKKAHYLEIATPTMLSDELWKQSGHYAHYKNNMYFCTVEQGTYAVKPMNCPGSILIYRERPRSYRELPMRLADFGLVHRHELSGVLHGLFRVRAFTIDDGHIYCTPAQIEEEVRTTIAITFEVLKKFGFDSINVALSTRPENSMGSEELWNQATNALKHALEKAHVAYELLEGEGAFYGPKIEFHIKDSMGRSWQCGTVQLDFFQPENFDLSYNDSDGTKKRPVMIHRAIYGSFERFLGVLLEHYQGKLPFWLAPVQIQVLTITDSHKPYARAIAEQLTAKDFRVEIDESSDPLAGQIKSAQLQNIPWMVVIGQKEMDTNTLTLRHLNGKQEFGLTFEQLIEKANELNQS
ncbi:MAG TPA: threonine--tRNA ligase [Candidatus Babeliales bacterium]|nr:threonine--tRNA ligase [Candidatus Babeliales bacterium]